MPLFSFLNALQETIIRKTISGTGAPGAPYVPAVGLASVLGVAENVHAPATDNTAAIVTYAAAGTGVCHVIGGYHPSYNATPSIPGVLTIEDGVGAVIYKTFITGDGQGGFDFTVPLRGSQNRAMIITLSAGGSGVTGVVSIPTHWTETLP